MPEERKGRDKSPGPAERTEATVAGGYHELATLNRAGIQATLQAGEAMLKATSSLAEELIKDLGVGSLELRSLEIVAGRLLPSLLLSNLKVLNRRIRLQILQNTPQRLRNCSRLNMTETVSNKTRGASLAGSCC